MLQKCLHFGIVFIEALASGKPVIMSNTDASETIVNKDNGLVVPIEDSDRLSEAMKTMIEEYDKYDNAKISADCRDRFSESVICNGIISIYRDVLDAHSGRIHS